MQKAIVIGAGFAGISAASVLAKQGFDVHVIEQHRSAGGRCRVLQKDGFTFDMGPSWYWMPDVFERFYQRFGHTQSDFYDLQRLDPSYQVVFKNECVNIPASTKELANLFEQWESGAAKKLHQFLSDAKYKYDVGMQEFVYKPSFSIVEFFDLRIAKSVFKLNLLSSLQNEVRQKFTDHRIRKILEFPVLFLGAKPSETPALYSLMNYADIELGTWYPKGGMHKVAQAFQQIAEQQNVQFHFNEQVTGFEFSKQNIRNVTTSKQTFKNIDVVVSGADYHHIEQQLPKKFQSYSNKYWENRKLSPSCLLFFIGVNKKLNNLQHHNLFFEEEFEQHATEIYDQPTWPTKPLFYVCAPSVTDSSVAPTGCENLFLLLPVAPNLNESKEIHEHYFNALITRIEHQIQEPIKEHIIVKQSFGIQDFKSTYNSFKGNAYGLANTLGQTAVLKPRMRSKKIDNLYYCGQLTVPGPGVPPSIISGQIIADYITKNNG